jgi:hypothetical protein
VPHVPSFSINDVHAHPDRLWERGVWEYVVCAEGLSSPGWVHLSVSAREQLGNRDRAWIVDHLNDVATHTARPSEGARRGARAPREDDMSQVDTLDCFELLRRVVPRAMALACAIAMIVFPRPTTAVFTWAVGQRAAAVTAQLQHALPSTSFSPPTRSTDDVGGP